jgi:hypothetical protein
MFQAEISSFALRLAAEGKAANFQAGARPGGRPASGRNAAYVLCAHAGKPRSP